MSHNKFENDIGKRISSSLKDSLSSGNFSGLKDAISDSVIDVIEEASSAFKESGSGNGQNRPYGYYKPHSTPKDSQAYSEELIAKRKAHNEKVRQNAEAMKQKKASYSSNNYVEVDSKPIVTDTGTEIVPTENFNPVGRVSGNVCFGLGIAGMIVSSAATLVNGIGFLVSGGGLFSLIFSGVTLAASAITLKVGLFKKGLLAKAKRLLQICGENMYAQVSSIASAMGVKTSKVKKDIKTLLQKGYFPQGYLDDQETTLMLSEDVYKQYRLTQSNSLKLIKEEEEIEKSIREELDRAKATLSPADAEELENMVTEGYACVKRLHKLNEQIPEESITNKLNDLEKVLRQIFKGVQIHPEQMKRMHKLMDYYLPTMLKLVEAYAEYDKVNNPGDEIIEAKAEIEATLDTIIEAFNQLLNNLFRDSVWDVTSDAQVLKTMLKQEGLATDLTND